MAEVVCTVAVECMAAGACTTEVAECTALKTSSSPTVNKPPNSSNNLTSEESCRVQSVGQNN
jgi:hypothetical protein